jgi:hypothetical protein
MNPLRIDPTKDSPKVLLDPISNKFEISGKSHPENVREFFRPILEWLDQYFIEIKEKENIQIEFNLNYSYMNSASYKYIIVLLKKMKEFYNQGIKIEFVWHYEEDDDDMKESGIELFELSGVGIPFRFNSYTE